MTITPSERHSGLMIRLSRYRRSDPAVEAAAPELQPWIGFNEPSLETPAEGCDIDLPEYDLSRIMTARDPLCCVHAFNVMVRVVLPNLYGVRMCPDCPHCAVSDDPCMDVFGSNATPMGGSNGRADAIIGAVEAQKAEGVLHLHFFIFLQMAHQFMSLTEIADKFKQQLLSTDALKSFHNHVRCSVYPDLDKFERERIEIESAWPAFAMDYGLNRPPQYSWDSKNGQGSAVLAQGIDLEKWQQEGRAWSTRHCERLQYVMSRMNHHIHPVIDASTGERRPLTSCQPKGKPKECKGGFPLDAEVTPTALLVCPCVARERGLATTGRPTRFHAICP